MAGPKDELLKAIEGISDEQAQTVIGWLGVLARKDPSTSGPQSVGTLGDALGMATVERKPGHSRMEMKVDPIWHNPNGVLHGGVIYTMVDYSMGSAVQPDLPEGQYCTTIEAKINYLRPAMSGCLSAKARVLDLTRRTAFAEGTVTDGEGRILARSSGIFFLTEAVEQSERERV